MAHATPLASRDTPGTYSKAIVVGIKGMVKWFDDAKGIGFITPDGDDREDILIYSKASQIDGFKTLAQGQKVEFEIHKGPKGFQAENVVPIAADKVLDNELDVFEAIG